MAKLKFFLRSQQTTGCASLYVRIVRPALGIRWWLNTNIVVDVAAWTKAQGSAKAMARYYDTDEGKEVQELTSEVDDMIKSLLAKKVLTCNDDKPKLEKAISNVVNVKGIRANEEAERRKAEARKAKAEEERNRLQRVWDYYEYFFAGIKDGSVLHGKQQRYSASSIAGWRTFGKHLGGFLGKLHRRTMTFDEIDRRIAAAFVTHLKDSEFLLATINQQVNHFRKLCNSAAEDGMNTNAKSLRVWKSHEEKDSEKRAEIVLTDREIDELYALKLEGHIEKCRDIWMLGYFCGQRVSDYSILSRDNFLVNGDGVPVIVLRQKKTGTEVQVPIIDDKVIEICQKYSYDFPRLGRDAINRGIKAACKILAQTVKSMTVWEMTLLTGKERDKERWYIEARKRVESGEKLHGEESKRYARCCQYAAEHDSGDMLYKRDYMGRVIRQRWELVGCHTSRRSLITSLHKTGLLTDREIMSVSGHSTLKSYETYLKVKTTERATSIYEKMKKAKQEGGVK